MKITKANIWKNLPEDYTGIIEWSNRIKGWFKNGVVHREDGPAYIRSDGVKSWWLDGKIIWISEKTLDLTNQIILSKTKHPEHPTVQIWKILGPNGLYEQIIIPGMEEFIIK